MSHTLFAMVIPPEGALEAKDEARAALTRAAAADGMVLVSEPVLVDDVIDQTCAVEAGEVVVVGRVLRYEVQAEPS